MSFIRFTLLVALGATSMLAACSKAPVVPSNLCTPGETSDCSCGPGSEGTQVCDDSGYFGDCACEGVPDGGSTRCAPGTQIACTCSIGTEGTQSCNRDELYDPCVCTEEEADGGMVEPCTTPEAEVCDGKDNDCNGVIDEGDACPIEKVSFASPSTRGVYFRGTTVEGLCGTDVLQRFWPTLLNSYEGPYDCVVGRFVFRRTDNALFYQHTFDGIFRDTSTSGPDELVPTAPCGDRAWPEFEFDGTGTLHYRCDFDVYRGDGELVTKDVEQLMMVMDDGRVVVKRHNGVNDNIAVVLDKNGNELSRLNPNSFFVGSRYSPVPNSTSVQGRYAYLLFDDSQAVFNSHSLIVYRLDGSNRWAQMRRLSVNQLDTAVVIADGTIFTRHYDVDGDEIIDAYLPNNSASVVWREADAKVVRAHGEREMVVGPR